LTPIFFSRNSHPRQWVDGSDPFYQEDRFLAESHPRQWVDGSDLFYRKTGFSRNPTHGSGWMVQILSTREDACCRKDLKNPRTTVRGIPNCVATLAVERI